MFSFIRKPIKRASITVGAAALVLSFIPGQAFATDVVSCGRTDYLQLWYHDGSGYSDTMCFANAGTIYPWQGQARWIDKVSTGNNDVVIHDDNGTDVYISRNNIVTYPNRPMSTRHVTIQ
ncbi:beta/gamma crystallin domain-containing protein [Actinoallomurus rhizosphaericola]|uniref:beta/gamma crystallin domain-containing protein n=1 Tax=Actinoallomurus rhizosphaericola TaxID=2952536 RepID=UPI0020938DD5|nr:beta/gamma crystallin domain-containing protein [Actinoallomurus rhizosphaericola]MCO5999989.1 hypothetical protein [Actinoallomurus rhizosphaericola]